MSAMNFKLAYAAMLFLIAAVAVMPQPRAQVHVAEAVSAQISTESRLAHAIAERVAIEARGDSQDARLSQLRAEEEDLRKLAFGDDASASRHALIDALADELSGVMARRTEVADADEVIRELTRVINVEVRGLSA